MAQELVDALPYWDAQEGTEALVKAELAKELASTPRLAQDEYLHHLPQPPELSFEGSAFLGTEFNRIRAGKPPIKFARRPKGPPQDANDVAGWEAALASAKAELGYQNAKMIHLQLLKKYGKDAWVTHNDDVAQTKDVLEREAETVKIEVNQINFNRKREHEKAGAKLDALEAKHWATVRNIDAVAAAAEDLAKRLKSDA